MITRQALVTFARTFKFHYVNNCPVKVGPCRVRCASSDGSSKTSVRAIRESGKKDFTSAGYALLIVPFTAFCLGTWQIKRRKWKLSLIEELEARTTAKPVPLPDNLETIQDLEYKKVIVRGKFDHSKELYMMPRSPVSGTLPETLTRSGRKMPEQAQSGANVITAFHVDSAVHPDLKILVNRGWVPREKLKPETRKEGQIEDLVELVGVVRLNEKRQQFAPPNNVSKNHWFHRDLDAMSTELDTAPIFIDVDRKSTIPGGPVGGQTIVTLRNEHMSYILTWYTLSAVTLFMWMKSYLRK